MVWRGGGGGLKEGGEISMWFDNGNKQTLSLSSSVESSIVLVLHEAECTTCSKNDHFVLVVLSYESICAARHGGILLRQKSGGISGVEIRESQSM